MKSIKSFIIYFAAILYAATAFAANTGGISGKTIDGENGEVLRGATIQVVGIKKGAKSDMKGAFKIKEMPSGSYKIKISFVGYEVKEIQDIKVENDIVNIGDIVLSLAQKETKEVVVSATKVMDNQAAVLAQRKKSAQLSDGISIEEIKKTPDADAGQSLKRVSGVTLVNDKFVYVRGVSERYSNTTLNGASLATTEPDKKAFAFDMFPADFLENANVAKSFTPDLPGNFAGGLVQLNTIDFPQGFSLKFSASASMTDNITFDKKFITYNGGATDWLGYDDGARSISSRVPGTPADFKKLTSGLKSQDDQALYAAQTKWMSASQSFNNKVWRRDTISAPPNGNFSLSYTDIFNVGENQDLGVMASAMYGNSYNLNALERGQLQADGQKFSYYGAGEQMTYSTNLGALFNVALKLGDNTSISLKNTFNNSSDDETTIINGYKDANYIKQYGFQYVQKTLFASQLGAEHRLPSLMGSTINWKLGYSHSLRDEPDFRRVRYSRNDTTQAFRVDIQDMEGNGYQAGRFFSNLKENAYTGSLDYTLPVENMKFKVGGLYEAKNREFAVRSFTIVKSSYLLKNYYDPEFGYVVPNEGDEDFYNRAFTLAPDQLFDASNFGLHKLGMSEETKPTDSYKADEGLFAGYLMADVPFLAFDKKFRAIVGARVESSQQKLQSYYAMTANNKDSVFVDRNQIDILPSINMIFEVTNDMNIRMSASQTLTRPSLREYAPFTFYDFQFQGDVTGNPNLKRALIQNYDIRWEWYPTPGEALSISGFYKKFDNAIEETIIPTSSNFKRTYTNANGAAFNYGIEFEARKNLGFISDIFNNLSFNLNLALIESQIEVKQVNKTDKRAMWGQSPYTLNLGLYYSNQASGTNVNLSYNVYGKRIIQVADVQRYSFSDPHVYELPRNVVDLSLSQSLFDNMEIKLTAKDLLNEKLVWKQHGQTVSSNVKGRGFSISFGYKIK
jgi:outer membrane receptor protein involved in Fe transport